jgi:hypothetical protein
MKNLMIYASADHQFDHEIKRTMKVQIDNSLNLGWQKEDIILATNFPYEYNGVKSLIVSDDNLCPFFRWNAKNNIILELFERGIIDDDIFWYHDCDVFQCVSFNPDEILPDKKMDMALTDYGRWNMWSCGSVYFRKEAFDIWTGIRKFLYDLRIAEEMSLMILTYGYDKTDPPYDKHTGYVSNKKLDAPIKPQVDISRVNKLNISYNFIFLWRPNRIHKLYEMADKPIKAVHFHPLISYGKMNMLDFFMGKNDMNIPLMPDSLIDVFKEHEFL